MRSGPYQAAVVGCGRIGATMEEDLKRILPATHAGAYRACPDTHLAAIVDRDLDRVDHTRRFFGGVRGFTMVEEMLVAVRPHIVSVATPPAQHRPVVEACARAGVPLVVCEKPLADSVEDARAIVKACHATSTILLVNHGRRLDPLLRRLRDEIAAGALGELRQATAHYTGGLINTGTHMVDLLRFFLGDVAWVIGVENPLASHPSGDLSVDALLGFASGARATLQTQEVKDFLIFALRLYGQAGAALIDRSGFEIERSRVRDSVDFTGYRELEVGAQREGTPRSFMVPLVDHAVACLEGSERPASTGEDGLAALETLVAVRASAAAGGRRIEMRPSRPRGER